MASQPSDGELTEEPLESGPTRLERGSRWKRAVTAIPMGLLIGGLVAWALANIGGSAIAFAVAAIVSGYYLYRKPLPSAVVGTGLYISAGLLVLTPVLFYVPVIFGPGSESGAEGAGAFIGGIAGLVIWGFAFFLVGIVLFVLGYFANRRAKNKLEKRNEMMISGT